MFEDCNKFKRGKIMKKKIALILTGALVMSSLVACSSSEESLVETYAAALEENGTPVDYMNLEVTDVDLIEVTDEDIATALETLSTNNAQATEVTDRAVQDGDVLNIDYVGYMDGEAFDGGTAEGQTAEIGAGSYIEGFEEGLIGANIGDTVTLDLAFPDDYGYEEYASLEVVFEITINSITEYYYPEITDEFIQEISDTCTTVEEYEAELWASYEADNLATQEYYKLEGIWTALVNGTELEVFDEEIIQGTVDYLNEMYTYQAYYYYYYETLDEFIAAMGLTTDEFDEYVLLMAEQAYISDSIISYIGVQEDILPSDDEFQTYIDDLLSMYGYTDEDTFFTDMSMTRDELEIEYLTEIVLDYLLDKVTFVEAEDTSEE